VAKLKNPPTNPINKLGIGQEIAQEIASIA
jgi:hypothetical protein